MKRTQLIGRTNLELRAEMLNAFNHPWFTPVTGAASNSYIDPSSFRVTAADSGRQLQLVTRISW